MISEPPVLVERRHTLGVLTLNRPDAINALTHEMVHILASALNRWEQDDTIETVLVTGSGERGLCAGGDIAAIYRDAMYGDGERSADFWADEYRLVARLARYPKPVVALQDGIVLGGGIGISAHCSHRVVTERSRLGLPETRIGFVPDVGATWLLSRAPGELGTAIALTASAVGAGDAVAVGLSDVYVPSERLPQLMVALQTDAPAVALAAVGERPPGSNLLLRQDAINTAFQGDSVTEIMTRLAGDEQNAPHYRALSRVSPSAAATTLRSLRQATRFKSLEEALVHEYRVSLNALTSNDFIEGVRAQIIDKDRAPVWTPATHSKVTSDHTSRYFETPLNGDLEMNPQEKR